MRIFTERELSRLRAEHPEMDLWRCPTCHDVGSYRSITGGTAMCDCARQRDLYMMYLHAGIGLTYQRLSWGDLREIEVPPPVAEYMDRADAYISRGVGLFLNGAVGTGKSLVAYLVLKELVRAGHDCYAATFSQTVESFTAGWKNPEEKVEFANRFMRSRVLLLDDLGKEASTRLSPTTLDHILRTRVQESRPTIVTSNLMAGGVESGYGTAVLSLLAEQSIGVEFGGDDFRPLANARTITEVRSGEVRPIV